MLRYLTPLSKENSQKIKTKQKNKGKQKGAQYGKF